LTKGLFGIILRGKRKFGEIMQELKNLAQWGVNIDDIPAEGLWVEFEDLKELNADLKIVKPFSGYLKLQKMGIEVEIKGHLKGSLEMTCDRCLEPFEFSIDKDFEVLLIPKKTLDFEEERELTSDELEVSFYENSFISYSEILHEEIILSLPFRKLCQPDCKGICQICGTNLNQRVCKCSKIKKDSPFAILKELVNPADKNI
jgi:uncharacterized protein